ncbi:MAG: hypothetical protein ACFFAH_10470 [Promethearchaeota archaeon]
MDSVELVKKMTLIHCARDPMRCDKCKKLEEEGEQFCLIKAFLKAGNIARPMTMIFFNNEKVLCEYDVEKVFKDEKEAKEYAINNSIKIQ